MYICQIKYQYIIIYLHLHNNQLNSNVSKDLIVNNY